MDEKEDEQKKCSLRNEKLKANQSFKERLRIRRKKIDQDGEQKKTTRGKEKVIRNRRPQETMPGHSQKIQAR